MAIKPKDIYEGTKKTHRAKKIIIAVVILLIALAIGLFFGLRHYCVYDDEGNATLIMPWERREGDSGESKPNESDAAPDPTPSEAAPASPEPSVTEPPADTPPDATDDAGSQPSDGGAAPSEAPSAAPSQSLDLGEDTGNP